MICFDAGISCGDPPPYDCKVTGNPTGIMCGATVDYTCDDCCGNDGSSVQSTCEPNGQWSVPQLECTRE